jgi:hypothetical protein
MTTMQTARVKSTNLKKPTLSALLYPQKVFKKIYRGKVVNMKNDRELQLAQKIIQLDLLRDELYEDLLSTLGCKAPEFLRAVQNNFEGGMKAYGKHLTGSA